MRGIWDGADAKTDESQLLMHWAFINESIRQRFKGRGDVAGWFKRFLGCTDVVIALKETKKLVETIGHFAGDLAHH